MAINEKYSKKSWEAQQFTNVAHMEFSNSTIRSAIFAQREPYTDVFPAAMTGAIFVGCNLDNCNIPPGNIVEDSCCNLHKKEQNDGEDWLVDKEGKPTEPVKPYRFDKWNVSKDPKDIPTEKLRGPITMIKEETQNLLLKDLIADKEKLISILVSEGKI